MCAKANLPFILGYLEHHVGAMSATTSGTPGDIDCFDETQEIIMGGGNTYSPPIFFHKKQKESKDDISYW